MAHGRCLNNADECVYPANLQWLVLGVTAVEWCVRVLTLMHAHALGSLRELRTHAPTPCSAETTPAGGLPALSANRSRALHQVLLSSLLAAALSRWSLEVPWVLREESQKLSLLPVASLDTFTQSTPPPSLGAAPALQAPRIWAHIGAHYSRCSLICPLLGAAHRL